VFIINTGRGQLIDDEAVAAALKKGAIGGYAADGLSVEPPSANHPLYGCPNCFITPHIAWQTREVQTQLLHIAAENLKSFHFYRVYAQDYVRSRARYQSEKTHRKFS